MQGPFESGKYETKSQFTLILLHINLFRLPDEGLSIWVVLSPLIDVFFNVHLVADYVISDFHSEIDYCRGPALVDPGKSKGGRRWHGKTCLLIDIRLD